MKRFSVALLALATALAIAPAALADTFSYTFQGSNLDAHLTFTAVSDGGGTYTITYVTGTILAAPDITPTTTVNTAPVFDPNGTNPADYGPLVPNGDEVQYDNLLSPGSTLALDFSGVLFDVGGVYVNIFSNNGSYEWLDSGMYSNTSNVGDPIAATPEPSSLLLLGTGLLALAFFAFRKSKTSRLTRPSGLALPV